MENGQKIIILYLQINMKAISKEIKSKEKENLNGKMGIFIEVILIMINVKDWECWNRQMEKFIMDFGNKVINMVMGN